MKAKTEEAGLKGKLTGSIRDVVAINITRGPNAPLLDTRSLPESKNRSILFYKWISQQGFEFPTYPRGGETRPFALYSFEPKNFVRVVGTEALLGGAPVPLGFWYQNEECFSPYEMLVESERRKTFPLHSVCKFGGVNCVPGYEPHTDAQEDARIAAELIVRFGLYPLQRATSAVMDRVLTDHLQPTQIEEQAEPEPESGSDEEPEAAPGEHCGRDYEEEVEEEDDEEEVEDGDEYEEEDDEEIEEESEIEEDEEEDDDSEYEYVEEEEEVEEEDDEEEEEVPPQPRARRRVQPPKK